MPGGRGLRYVSRAWGTGTLIGDRVVLSCAHVVYEPAMGWADSITFYPGYRGESEPSDSVTVASGLVRDTWINSRDDSSDISLLLLDKPVGGGVGYMPVASRPVSFFFGPTLNLTGYAGDLAWGVLYEGSGPATGVKENLIVHYIDGGPGQSGGPLWYLDDTTGLNTLVGVFVGDAEVSENGQVTDVYGIGVRVNSEICAWINDYLIANDPTATTSCDGTAGEDTIPSCGGGIGGIFPFLLVGLALMRRTCASGMHPKRAARVRPGMPG